MSVDPFLSRGVRLGLLASDLMGQFPRSGRTRPLAWRREQFTRLRALLTDNREAIADALWADLRKNAKEVDTAEIRLTILEIDDDLEHIEEWVAPGCGCMADLVTLPR